MIILAGAKGAVGSTVAAAAAAYREDPRSVVPSLTASALFSPRSGPPRIDVAGWDGSSLTLGQSLERHGVVPPDRWKPNEDFLARIPLRPPPPPGRPLPEQVGFLKEDLREFLNLHPGARPVLVNLLPACDAARIPKTSNLDALLSETDPAAFPDLAYALAAVQSGVPVANFTPNPVEQPSVLQEAARAGVPIAGRDGKTGQTYFKVALASAFRARRLRVDGWYSLNILGNEDGRNLAEPGRAEAKLENKTEVLDEALGYRVGERYGASTHRVRIDYYPPRGDAKEAWDVVDFVGLLGMPMSLRVNLLARDSILAAPLVVDLALWMTVLHQAGRRGPVPELAFYFKKAIGPCPPLTFPDQVAAIEELENKYASTL